nr:synaptobrevin, longin-like domain protein [Tanacetum cinerariifolium]
NDVTRLQALVDKKKVIITEATIRDALRLNDAESIECLSNEEIFNELSRMRYEKPSTKLTLYKAFFSPQWKFLIHTILQCMSVKRTSWNEFSSSMASAVICLSTGKGFSRVDTPLFEGMIVAQQNDDVADEGAASIAVDDVPAANEPSIPSPTPTNQPPPPLQDLHSTSQERILASMDAYVDVTLKDVADIAKEVVVDAEIEQKPAELQEVVEVVITAKLITEVVFAASATITAATTPITAVAITTAPSAARRRKGVIIRDPEETATPSIIIHSEPKSKDKRKGILKFNSNMAFLEKTREQMEEEEEDSKALKRTSESQAKKEAKKQKLDEDVEELKRHLQIVPNDEDDVYTEATPLARKVLVVDYEIYTENNKPYYKIIRADESPQLFLRFLSLLRNFDREDLEVLWELVKDRFASSKPKNFSDDFLLTTLTYLFEKPDVYTDNLDGREKISTYKVHFGSNAQQCQIRS